MPRRNQRRSAPIALSCLALAIAVVLTGSATAPHDAYDSTTRTPTTSTVPPTASAAQPAPTPVAPPPPVAAGPVKPDELARLPKATTFGTTPDAPPDTRPRARPSGLVVHPNRTVPVYAKPGGQPIAALPATQLGADTWLPVIEQKPGWLRVLLPSRPNGSTGWLHHNPNRLQVAQTPYLIEVDRARFRLTLSRADSPGKESWTAGIGKPGAVTPAGRTFVLANVHDTKATFSDIVLPLGTHSDTYTSYGGGPGTVGIHTWPTSDAFGTASSDGCIRIPHHALKTLSTTVPLGTPVLIR